MVFLVHLCVPDTFLQDEHEKSLYAEQIMSFLNPFLDALVTERHRNNASDTLFGHVVHRFESYCKEHEAEKNHLKELMGVERYVFCLACASDQIQRLVIPFMDINLPGEFVLAYNELDAEDPQVSFYQQHTLIAPEIRKLGVFLNRYDTNEEVSVLLATRADCQVLCHFVWSTVDALLIALPSVNLNPYPLCWTCQNTFATKVCAGCHVAKYCSKECQRQDWNTLKGNIPGTPKTNHKHLCRELSDLCTEHNVLTL